MSATKTVGFVVGVAVLYAALTFATGALAGAGHGSDFFLAALLAPFSAFGNSLWVLIAGFALWVLAAFFVAMRRFLWCRFAAGAVLTTHYLGLAFVSAQFENWGDDGRVWRAASITVIVVVLAYLTSQAFFWSLIARRPHEA